MTRSSIASVTPEAGFSIGSYLASVNSQQSAVLNATPRARSEDRRTSPAASYQGLANTNVTINQLITASGGLLTSSNVMTASLPGAQWLSIWSNAVANQVAQLNCGPRQRRCLASAARPSAPSGHGIDAASLCQLVSIDGSTCSPRTPPFRRRLFPPASTRCRRSPPRPKWPTAPTPSTLDPRSALPSCHGRQACVQLDGQQSPGGLRSCRHDRVDGPDQHRSQTHRARCPGRSTSRSRAHRPPPRCSESPVQTTP